MVKAQLVSTTTTIQHSPPKYIMRMSSLKTYREPRELSLQQRDLSNELDFFRRVFATRASRISGVSLARFASRRSACSASRCARCCDVSLARLATLRAFLFAFELASPCLRFSFSMRCSLADFELRSLSRRHCYKSRSTLCAPRF